MFTYTAEEGGVFTLAAGGAADILRADMVLANPKQKTEKKKERDEFLKQFPWKL